MHIFSLKFLNTSLLDGLYFDTWYDLTDTTPENSGYIFYQNKVILSISYVKINLDNFHLYNLAFGKSTPASNKSKGKFL